MPWALRDEKLRQLCHLAIILVCLNLLQFIAYPQHFSPMTSLIYLLVAAGLRELWLRLTRKHYLAERLCAALFVSIVFGALLSLFREPLGLPTSGFWEWPHSRYFRDRAALQAKAEVSPASTWS